MDDAEDATSLGAICNGPPPARAKGLAQLHRRYAAAFKAYFRRNGQSAENAEDLVQDVFLKVLRFACQFTGKAKASSWLWSIARRQLLDDVKGRAAPGATEGDMAEIPAPEGTRPGGRPRSGDEPTRNNLIDDCVSHALQRFAREEPERAELLRRCVLDGWAVADAAQFLGRKPGATRQYLSECRKKFAPFLEPCRSLLSDEEGSA
jgi:RNA polymerase sigma-70 factor, ECF subfamily